MTSKLPLATVTWGTEEYEALNRVISSGFFTMGAEVEKFESQFSDYIGSRYAVMVNSGSSANLLMTAALFFSENEISRLRPGDEIIVPAVSWSTTYYPLTQYGLILRFVDIDINTLNYDLGALRQSITPKTKAIMIVNLLGNPNEFDQIFDIVGKKNIILIEDNCESLGAVYNETKTGTFGKLGSFSTYFSHHISTIEGGLVVTDDEELYHIMLSLRAHGWTRELPIQNRITGKKSVDHFEESFNFVLPGYNLRPTEMSGALGQQQLKKLPDFVLGRRKNAELIKDKLSDSPIFSLQTEIGESSWFGFSLVLRPSSKMDRVEFVDRLEKHGFECRPIVAGNFTKNPVMRHIPHTIFGELTNADYIHQNGLFIGNHHYSIEDAIDILCKI